MTNPHEMHEHLTTQVKLNAEMLSKLQVSIEGYTKDSQKLSERVVRIEATLTGVAKSLDQLNARLSSNGMEKRVREVESQTQMIATSLRGCQEGARVRQRIFWSIVAVALGGGMLWVLQEVFS